MPEHGGANLSALNDLCTPWCIHLVATLRIADHIAAGAGDIDALAATERLANPPGCRTTGSSPW